MQKGISLAFLYSFGVVQKDIIWLCPLGHSCVVMQEKCSILFEERWRYSEKQTSLYGMCSHTEFLVAFFCTGSGAWQKE